MLNAILKSKTFYGVVLILIPVYTWSRFFRIRMRLKKKLKDQKLFYSRHNCVVMYDKRGITGWPSGLSPIESTLSIYEPILYFIHTAQKTLDIAVMVISNNTIANALVKAHKRGIQIRMLLDHDYSQNSRTKTLQNSGIKILYYVCPDQQQCSIMHYKYMLKDYSNDGGYVYMGSQNWTNVAFLEYYENTVFTTDNSVVEAIHKNFEETCSFVEDLCKTNVYVKAKLQGIQ